MSLTPKDIYISNRRRLGAIMTKLGFEKSRKGHNNLRGYYVVEHTQSEIEKIHNPEVF